MVSNQETDARSDRCQRLPTEPAKIRPPGPLAGREASDPDREPTSNPPMILNNEMLLTQLNWRYATKKFDSARKISAAAWATLQQALQLSPSSYGLQPWRFIVVGDPQLRRTLRPLTTDQPQITDCSHFVVFARKNVMTEADVEKLVNRTTDVRGLPRGALQKYYDTMVGDIVKGPRSAWVKEWTARQTYIALGSLLTAAALLGVDACPMEGLDPAGYDEVLGLAAKGYSTVCACALGYRAEDDPYAAAKKVRYEFSEMSEQR
jgi:nitroreductase